MGGIKVAKQAKVVLNPLRYLYASSIGSKKIESPPTLVTPHKYGAPEVVIYCLHGTAAFPGRFAEFNYKLIQSFNSSPYNITIRTPKFKNRFRGECIHDYAEQLLLEILKNHDQHKTLVFVGHSRGGLIASYFTEFIAPAYTLNIPIVTTLSSPFKGCRLAELKIPFLYGETSMEEMRADSEFLKTLCLAVSTSYKSGRVQYKHYIGAKDGVVNAKTCHPYSSSPDGNLTVIPEASHAKIIDSPLIPYDLYTMINNYFAKIQYGQQHLMHKRHNNFY